MIVIVKNVMVNAGFGALLEIDDEGRLVRVRAPEEGLEEHFRARVVRVRKMAPEVAATSEGVVSWLVRDNSYLSFEIVDTADFDSLYQELTMPRFYVRSLDCPVASIEEVRALAHPAKHWKDGRSAKELTKAWIGTDNIPFRVSSVLNSCPTYKLAEMQHAIFEKKVNLGTPGRDSQTDLMVYMTLFRGGAAVVAVEGKVNESFGPIVGAWLGESVTKAPRLEKLCHDLGIPVERAMDLRYQLFHRTASAVYEAEKTGAEHALMLVHSFSDRDASFRDFQDFAQALGAPVSAVDTISEPITRLGIELRLGWVKDKVS